MMQINTPLKKKIVKDYDFVFTSGVAMPVTIDEAAGDTISYKETSINIHLNPKPSFNDPSVMLPAEDIVVFHSHLLTIQTRSREVSSLTVEEQNEWAKTLNSQTSKTIQ